MLCDLILNIIRMKRVDCFFCRWLLPEYDFYYCAEHGLIVYDPNMAGCKSFERSTMSIEINNVDILRSILEKPYHPQLVELVCWFADTAGSIFITSVYRDDSTNVHGRLRGIDLRSWIYANPRALCKRANEVWKYDPIKRPKTRCAKVHDKGKGVHIHLQVHPKTVYIGE